RSRKLGWGRKKSDSTKSMSGLARRASANIAGEKSNPIHSRSVLPRACWRKYPVPQATSSQFLAVAVSSFNFSISHCVFSRNLCSGVVRKDWLYLRAYDSSYVWRTSSLVINAPFDAEYLRITAQFAASFRKSRSLQSSSQHSQSDLPFLLRG